MVEVDGTRKLKPMAQCPWCGNPVHHMRSEDFGNEYCFVTFMPCNCHHRATLYDESMWKMEMEL